MSVRLSVALCTFNGGIYLPEQLRSLVEQTRRPDELVVRDDGSTDDTIQILHRFAESAPFPVSLEINEKRLGPAKNFEQAIAACGGDVIALCDQDDIWVRTKLAAIEEAFEGDPALGAFFSDAEMCASNGADLGYRLWTSVGLTGRLKQIISATDPSGSAAGSSAGSSTRPSAFDVILRQNVVTGATLAFAGRFRSLVLPIDPLWMHDGWIALLISAHAEIHADPRSLIRYRQHPNQSVGAARRSLFQQYVNARNMDRHVFAHQADMYQAALNRLKDFSFADLKGGTTPGGAPADHLRRLTEKIRHFRARSDIRLRQRSRLLPSLAELLSFRYQRFSLGWKSFAQDFFL